MNFKQRIEKQGNYLQYMAAFNQNRIDIESTSTERKEDVKICDIMDNVKRQLKAGSELTGKQLQMEQKNNRMDGWKG